MKSQNKKIRILCYFDYDQGRDVEILMPVIYYAETYLNAKVEFAFLRDIHKIYKQKPNLVLLANAIGSELHFLISKYAVENNISVFSLVSEGNFRTNGTFNYWGYNIDKKIYQDTVCLWSKRTLDFLSNELPHEKEKMAVTGAIGFDRYKIYEFVSKENYLKQIGYSQYKKVIVYAGWGFGKIFNKTGIIEVRNSHKENADERINWMKTQMLLVEDILRKAVEKNPNVLFIMKRHPNEIHPHLKQADRNEMVNLKDYPNVIYTVDANIHDLISIADIFTGFETTTAMESWILDDTPTILLNPNENFKRDKIYKGSVIAHSSEEFQNKIEEFYNNGKIDAFLSETKKQARKQLIQETIGFADGMNHVRAGFHLGESLKKIQKDTNNKVKFTFSYFIWYYLVHIGKFFYWKPLFLKLPKFKKTVWIFDNVRLKNLNKLKQSHYKYLDIFHTKHKIKEKINNPDFWGKITDTSEHKY